MEKVYIFGHKKPDTDSVAGAISFAYLKNHMIPNWQTDFADFCTDWLS